MKSYCPNCRVEYDGKIYFDDLGPHVACKECGGSWDVDNDVVLKDIDFCELVKSYHGLSVFLGDYNFAEGCYADVLKRVTPLADRRVVSTNVFFGIFVIRLEEPVAQESSAPPVSA